ncbi:thiol-disulfide oxidoreductase DCC family protein [Leptothoe sp. PORK10 BA2]|uniref:thiol-disulfide oxidoreductase DCC family protein n=1 Tax=Leptothoe sp. PORK10 BA2 TaxID=3110254 RepID=UPI002B1F942D|nr:DCC1-like thiol-disulfide oxidoreductase family protein [Leptothoe sp. PORK10 BA2]MEA5465935.1 DCC1-like thiol-disulfide oxidoreductase family protein [Leptothoe sp. PORK10 BA2]
MHFVIYDGDCNLCTTLVQFLGWLDRGQRFRYGAMQDTELLKQFNVTAADCELGMLLIDAAEPMKRWQGSDAAEEIGALLPTGALFLAAYRGLPGLNRAGDRVYGSVRDNRYRLFGRRSSTYESAYGICQSDRCEHYF